MDDKIIDMPDSELEQLRSAVQQQAQIIERFKAHLGTATFNLHEAQSRIAELEAKA